MNDFNKTGGGVLVIDLSFWKVEKNHTWLDDTALYLLRRDEMFAVVLLSADEVILDTYTTFDNKNALATFNKWKDRLMKNHKEWDEEI